jgi:MFS family permease
MPKLFTADFLRLTGGQFLHSFGFSAMPLLPVYLGWLGASREEIGQIMAAAAVGGLLCRPVVGWALDRFGRRSILIIGSIMSMLALAMVGFIDTVGPLAYCVRFLFGMGEGALFTGYFAFASDIIPEERRTEGLAIFGIFGLIPIAINPVVGGLGFEVAELRYYFPLLALLLLSSIVVIWPLRERVRAEDRPPFVVGDVLRALGARRLWSVWFATSVFAALVSVFMTFATVSAEARGISSPSLFWLTYGTGAVGVRLFGARIPDRVGPSNLLAPSLGLYGLAFVLLSSASDLSTFLVAGLLAGLGHGYCFPVLVSQVVSRMADTMRGSAIAMFTALWEVAALWAGPVFGRYADYHTDGAMFSLVGLGALGGLIVWVFLEHVSERNLTRTFVGELV